MPDPRSDGDLQRQKGEAHRLADRVFAPQSVFQRHRWAVWLITSLLLLAFVTLVWATESGLHPLHPLGGAVVTLSIVGAVLSGLLVGLGTTLVGIAAAFVLLADFGSLAGTVNAIVSALLWCGATAAFGVLVGRLREQIFQRQSDMEEALGRSAHAREGLERVLDFSPQFHLEGDLATVSRAICETAVNTFAMDSARLYSLEEDSALRLLASIPTTEAFAPGVTFPLKDVPDNAALFQMRRPFYQESTDCLRLIEQTLPGQDLSKDGRDTVPLDQVSAVRIPIVGALGAIGMLSLSRRGAYPAPNEETFATMQRFADQAAIAWQNARRVEAQQQADELRRTLDTVLALAPSFHINATREKVAEAISEAAVTTFECDAASVYRVEGARIRLLARVPQSDEFPTGKTYPLPSESLMAQSFASHKPVFVPDALQEPAATLPWPLGPLRKIGIRSGLLLPIRFNERGPRNIIVLSWHHLPDRPDENFMVVVQRFGDQAALALSSASAVQLHAQLEASLLSAQPVVHPELEIIRRYRVGEQRLRLGGDFLANTLGQDGSLYFAIGDVSGHGANAAALGATLRTTWRALSLAERPFAETLRVMEEVLIAERTASNIFATLVFGLVQPDTRHLSILNVGHLPPILITPEGSRSLDTPPVLPLGFVDLSRLTVKHFDLPEAWSLMCYTDGLVEARLTPGSDERYGEQRLLERMRSWPGLPDEQMLDQLIDEVEAGNGGPFADDVAIMLISPKKAAGNVIDPRPKGGTRCTASGSRER